MNALSSSWTDDQRLQVAPDTDLGMSYMYSLFNFMPAGTEGHHSLPSSVDGSIAETQRGLQIYPEIDRTLISISAVCVVTRLALDLGDDEV